MIKPKPGQTLPLSDHSRTKILFICDCGNEKWITWKNYKTNHTKSCGNCKYKSKYNIDVLKNKKFGFLKIDKSNIPNKFNSNTKFTFICDCGNKKDIALKSVINGLTKSCGCGLARKHKNHPTTPKHPKSYWIKQKLPLKLLTPYSKLPNSWPKGSNIKLKWLCRCGREFTSSFGHIYSGHTSSCGKCDYINKEVYLNIKFGKLQLLDIDLPEEFHKNTDQKFWFKCDCGNKKKISIHSVIKNKQKSCGECNLKPKEWWKGKRFGHLTVIDAPKDTRLHSEAIIKCGCSCGEVCFVPAADLTRRHTKTCGNCLEKAKLWHKSHNFLPPKTITKGSSGIYKKEDLKKYFEHSYFIPLEDITTTNCYSRFICKLCGREFRTKLAWIHNNKTMSCGCVKGSVSAANIEIGRFIESLGFKASYGKNEPTIGNYKYDIVVDSLKLIIEYNGLRYHSTELNIKNNDLKKYREALRYGYQYLMIYEDEWAKKKDLFKQLIKNRLGINRPKIKLRPRNCKIRFIDNKTVKPLYEQFHYQGHVNSTYNVGAYYDNILVAAMSIKHPTRQNSGDWEISRMVRHSNYQIYGLWSYLTKLIRNKNLISGKLVTFSDNRLMTGKVYKIMGFVKEKDVHPDYYWVKGLNRYHKSALRKTKEEQQSAKTESELRKSQNYHKLFDLGKVKWSIYL